MKHLAVIAVLFLCSGVRAQEAAGYHSFTGKSGAKIEARILSISDDRSTLKLEGRDGKAFESKITSLSLDDQQFVRRWLKNPGAKVDVKGRIRAFGTLPENRTFPKDAATTQNDFVAIDSLKSGWLGLRESGQMITASGRNSGMNGVKWMGVNAIWSAFVMRDGTVRDGQGRAVFPGKLTNVEQAVRGANHHAARLLDGSVVVWGKAYGDPKAPVAPLEPLENIIDIASTQGKVAAVDAEGRVFCWDMQGTQIKSAMLGDGIVEVDGGIFGFIALTRSGKVLEWLNSDLESVREPRIELGGKVIAVRAGGSTRAARREDGTWIAWGKDTGGIIEKINNLGPVPDIAFFTEPGASKVGWVAWIEK